MKNNQFTLLDLTDDLIEHADMYIKRVLINKKRRYFRRLRKLERNGVTILELEKYESNLIYEDPGYEEFDITHFYIDDNVISISMTELASALKELTGLQLNILMKNEILGVSVESLAREYGISKRMVRKHRQVALEKLQKRLVRNND